MNPATLTPDVTPLLGPTVSRKIPQARSNDLSVVREFTDDFTDDQRPGHVIGTSVPGGVARKGIDREGVIGIDNGALRIEPMVKSRWGRAGIAYGPYERRNGLAFGVSILNGHNTSQTGPLPEGLKLRLKRWILGSETEKASTRLVRWARSRQKQYMWRRILHWTFGGSRYLQTTTVDENLAVGWFPREVPSDPAHQGNAFLMHALGPECGELWARVGVGTLRSVRGVQNVHMYYVVVLREQGAAYYAASVKQVPGFGAYPTLRPLAIDSSNTDATVYAGVHQSVLGQVGFRVDTRVYRTQVAMLPEYSSWYGSAVAADTLTGTGSLHASPPAAGGSWLAWDGTFSRTERGLKPSGASACAVMSLPQPAGLVHAVVDTDETPMDVVALLFRVRDRDNFWAFEVGTSQCTLVIKENGAVSRFPSTKDHYLAPNASNSVQVCDDGQTIRLYVKGDLAYGTHFTDDRISDGAGVGLRTSGRTEQGAIRSFEAHPREISLPQPLDLGEPWQIEGSRVVAADDFRGATGNLAGRTTPEGALTWHRSVGQGEIRLTGDGAAKVRATLAEPCPGRTAYALPWHDQRFAELSVEITPPGIRRGAGERGRGGLIFWQDDRNYITFSIFVDDWYGMSIAAFYYRDGYEELYDAIWTNIGKRVHWGMPYTFKAVFDSSHYMTYVNGEPVMQRALHDVYPDWHELKINEVGIVANWEWGSDTGTIFRDFLARDRA